MTALIAAIPWQVLLIPIVGAGAALAIIWSETRRRLAQVLDLDDRSADRGRPTPERQSWR